jgi:tetratricopeptide (TPR) repeat protein
MVVLAVVSSAAASERSEILTAKGEVAYGQKHSDEAVRLLEQAVVADPNDPYAHEALGQVLLGLGRHDAAATAFERAIKLDPTLQAAHRGLARARGDVEPGAGVESTAGGTVGELGRLPSMRSGYDDAPWGFSVTTGFQYDSNVTVEPNGTAVFSTLPGEESGPEGDWGWVAAFGAEYDLFEGSNFLVKAEYDLYQTLHLEISDFDFRAQQPRLTASYGLTPELWVGTQGGYNYYSLGSSTYQGEPYVLPFVSYLEGTWGLTQVMYRWGEDTYFSDPFAGSRDGPNQTINASQTIYLANDRYVTAGYLWNNENPRETFCDNPDPTCDTFGKDWQFTANQGYLGVGSPLPFGAYIDLLYLFRSDNYRWKNSYSARNIRNQYRRQDDGNYLYVGLTRPITEHIALAVTYYGTFNASNIDDFEYNRNVVGTLLQVTY